MTEYIRTVDDELDWSLLDQLHAVVLQIGAFCFRTKQVFLTILIGVIGLIITLTSDKLDDSIFVAGILIPICFWFLDSIAFYYQAKLREVMIEVRARIKNRNSNNQDDAPNKKDNENSDTNPISVQKIQEAFFNHSMWLYYIAIVVDCILWVAFSNGVIK